MDKVRLYKWIRRLIIIISFLIALAAMLCGQWLPKWLQIVITLTAAVGVVLPLCVELPCAIINGVWFYQIKTEEGKIKYERYYRG